MIEQIQSGSFTLVGAIIGCGLLLGLIGLLILPIVVASNRRVANTAPVAVLTVAGLFATAALAISPVAGGVLSFVCWVGALVWACAAPVKPPPDPTKKRAVKRPAGYTGAIDLTYRP